MDGFIDAYVRATGAKQRIPAHWLDVPSIAKDFSLTPRQRKRSAGARSTRRPAKPVAKPSTLNAPTDGEKEN